MCTKTNAIPVLIGKFFNSSENASRPPAEAPMLTTERFLSSLECELSTPFLEPLLSVIFFITHPSKYLTVVKLIQRRIVEWGTLHIPRVVTRDEAVLPSRFAPFTPLGKNSPVTPSYRAP